MIKITSEGEKTTVSISGSIDIVVAEKLKEALNKVGETKPKEIILDFKKVDLIGSVGIGQLLLTSHRVKAWNGKIFIINVNSEIYSLFKLVKMDKQITISRAC